MAGYQTLDVGGVVAEPAPDGCEVLPLLRTAGGSMAQFRLPARTCSSAVVHATVDEIWLVIGGRGQMWRADESSESIEDLHAGVCLSIPRATRFQFRCTGDEPLTVVAVTTPVWPGEDEATVVTGPWEPSLK